MTIPRGVGAAALCSQVSVRERTAVPAPPSPPPPPQSSPSSTFTTAQRGASTASAAQFQRCSASGTRSRRTTARCALWRPSQACPSSQVRGVWCGAVVCGVVWCGVVWCGRAGIRQCHDGGLPVGAGAQAVGRAGSNGSGWLCRGPCWQTGRLAPACGAQAHAGVGRCRPRAALLLAALACRWMALPGIRLV